jgi:hypothetical protein
VIRSDWVLIGPANFATRFCAGFAWALVAASVVFWGSLLLCASTAAPPRTASSSALPPAQFSFVRLPGESVAAELPSRVPPAASRFHLGGIVAPTQNDGEGIALIAVDGQRARVFRVGDAIDAELRLDKVSQRGAVLRLDERTAPIFLELTSLDAAIARVAPPRSGATDIIALPATPGSAAAEPASSGVEPGPLLAPAADLVQELPARSPGPLPNTLGLGRRLRLRGLTP